MRATDGAIALDWDKLYARGLELIQEDKSQMIGLLVLIGMYSGLRFSDIRVLRFEDFNNDVLTLKEKKTGKVRTINLSPKLVKPIRRLNKDGYIFKTMRSSVGQDPFISTTYANRVLKRYLVGLGDTRYISSHSLRKSFGKRIYELNNKTDESLTKLSVIFNHSSVAVTRRYIGITKKEIADIYMGL